MKDSSIRVRMTNAERITLHQIAQAKNTTVSEMIRSIADQGGYTNVKKT